ncbi:MAG: hypothetical protein EXR68_07875 [Dehalococcoidia bacterium]|nr:hypothetical protein [Dehalococcoidia bacterium]
MQWYLSLDEAGRTEFAEKQSRFGGPGIAGGHEVIAWLWDHQIVGFAAGDPGVAAIGGGEAHGLNIHTNVIQMIGLLIGERWCLEDLSDDCAADGRYKFLLVSAPLNLPGGSGSPANALAIK